MAAAAVEGEAAAEGHVHLIASVSGAVTYCRVSSPRDAESDQTEEKPVLGHLLKDTCVKPLRCRIASRRSCQVVFSSIAPRSKLPAGASSAQLTRGRRPAFGSGSPQCQNNAKIMPYSMPNYFSLVLCVFRVFDDEKQ